MAVRSYRFCEGSDPPTGGTNVFTVPAGRTALVKTIAIENEAAAGLERLFAYKNSSAAANKIFATGTIGASSGLIITGLSLVWFEGETIRLASSSGNLRVSVHGALLLGSSL